MQIIPPCVQPARTVDQIEPRRQRRIQRFNLLMQVVAFDPPHLAHFAWIWLNIDVLLQEQNVVDFVFAPPAVALVDVVNARQIVEVFGPHLCVMIKQKSS